MTSFLSSIKGLQDKPSVGVAGGGQGWSVAPIPRHAAEQNFYSPPRLKTLRRLRTSAWEATFYGGVGGGGVGCGPFLCNLYLTFQFQMSEKEREI